MKELKTIKKMQDSKELSDIGLQIMDYMFTKSQENLLRAMPWGTGGMIPKSPTVISDQSGILQSGVPPHWVRPNRLEFEYKAPHASMVEFGSGPHPVAAKRLFGWVQRKLGKSGKEALGISFAIANKIKKEGMPPHPWLRPALSAGQRKFGITLVSEP